MPDHNTLQVTIDCLKEVVACLTQGQTSPTQNHASLSQVQSVMNSKIDSILELLVAITTIPSSPHSSLAPIPPPSPPH
ncbi:hypothetical protein HKD37_04G010399 [Glycine soja]